MIHGLLWLPLLMAFILIAALGWIERRRQNLYLIWAKGSELAKLDGTGAARLKAGILCWSSFEAGSFKEEATFEVNTLPGFTKTSMYPTLWEASGLKLEKLVASLIETAKE